MRTLIRSRIWLLLLLACAPSDQGAGTESSPGIQHPRPEYLAYRNLRTISAHVNDSSTPMLTAELSALRNAPSQLTIGGNQDTPFDDIRELVPLPRGELLVTDNAATAIHLLGANGKLARVGGSGEGPGEFQRATSAAPLPGGRLVIADVRRRLEQFSLHNGAATYSESF